MKKALSVFLVLMLCLSLCACGGGKTEEVAGTYKSISLFLDNTYQLNENGTYDKSPSVKGTYKTGSNGGFALSQNNSSSEEIFAKKENYYYRTNLICCFEKDDEYGLEATFDKNGRSNQSFTANYETINQTSMLVKTLGLILNEDGTYKLNDMQVYITQGKVVAKETFEGTYKFENDILWLNNNNKDYPLLLVKGKLYFDILEKIE